MRARVYLQWTPSISNDVVAVHVRVLNGENVVYNESVTPDVNSVPVGIFNEGTVLRGEVVVSDGTNLSDVAVAGFTVPDLTKPETVTDLGFTYEVVQELDKSRD